MEAACYSNSISFQNVSFYNLGILHGQLYPTIERVMNGRPIFDLHATKLVFQDCTFEFFSATPYFVAPSWNFKLCHMFFICINVSYVFNLFLLCGVLKKKTEKIF